MLNMSPAIQRPLPRPFDPQTEPPTSFSPNTRAPMRPSPSQQLQSTMERPIAEMDSLPPELLELILLWTVRMCRCEKNKALQLRYVSKAFNTALRPYVLRTVQLEFSRFLRGPHVPRIEALEALGGFCQAVYLDMMVVRDEGMLGSYLGVDLEDLESRRLL